MSNTARVETPSTESWGWETKSHRSLGHQTGNGWCWDQAETQLWSNLLPTDIHFLPSSASSPSLGQHSRWLGAQLSGHLCDKDGARDGRAHTRDLSKPRGRSHLSLQVQFWTCQPTCHHPLELGTPSLVQTAQSPHRCLAPSLSGALAVGNWKGRCS